MLLTAATATENLIALMLRLRSDFGHYTNLFGGLFFGSEKYFGRVVQFSLELEHVLLIILIFSGIMIFNLMHFISHDFLKLKEQLLRSDGDFEDQDRPPR